MSTFQWLESLALARWVGESLWGYPLVLTLHALGLAVVVGINVMLDLRIVGGYRDISLASISRLLRVAWVGFVVNVLSGVLLFVAEATKFVANTPFLIKIALILLAAINTALLQNALRRNALAWDSAGYVGRDGQFLAYTSMSLWIGAIVSGRLIAYF